MKALLLGQEPGCCLGYTYVDKPPYDGVVIGSAQLHQLLSFDLEPALTALAEGKPVLLYTPGLPQIAHNRPLAAALTARYRELKNWGVRFTDGQQKRLITAQQAKAMVASGQRPGPGAVLTPLAKEILEGSQ